MPIVVQLDVMLARRKAKSKDLAEHVGITEANLSLLKQGKVKVSGLKPWPAFASSWIVSPVICWCLSLKRKRPQAVCRER